MHACDHLCTVFASVLWGGLKIHLIWLQSFIIVFDRKQSILHNMVDWKMNQNSIAKVDMKMKSDDGKKFQSSSFQLDVITC